MRPQSGHTHAFWRLPLRVGATRFTPCHRSTANGAFAWVRPFTATFDLYASALDGATRFCSNPVAITYGPLVTDYELDGTGNRDSVTRQVEVAEDTYLDLLTVPYELLGNTHVNGFACGWVFTKTPVY